MKKILACTLLLLSFAGASAQALWRGVPAGATPAEVSALIPEAVPASADWPATEVGRVLLEIPAHELLGVDFAVAFGFEKDRLQGIQLQTRAATPQEARAIAQRLTTSLKARYGLEISTKSRQDRSSTGIDRKWSYRRTSVHLEVLDETTVRLRYRPETVRAPNPL
ncbi:hypothetical protein [Hydrogenophaga sp.]|uniref:hypothetical protein n=1 Tax=Hydrogenophaga sp. TaxID=1904254 RepID=UPI003D12BE83